jgi:alpha-glucoside transport system substrate-binding protein
VRPTRTATTRTATTLLAALVLAAPAACTSGDDVAAGLDGVRVEVLAGWTGTEAERFDDVLRAFERRTGADVVRTPVEGELRDVLEARAAAGSSPDVVVLAQPGLLVELASAGRLRPLDAQVAAEVREGFPRPFVELGTVDGTLFGVWFKAANKSLVWYDVATFERLGVVPPLDLDGLHLLVERLTAQGVPAFAVAGATGWTLTDVFENLYLRTAGGQRYEELAAYRIPWTHPSVLRALAAFDELLPPASVAGGLDVAATTDFATAVRWVLEPPARAAMVVEGDFVAGVVAAEVPARLGVDVDVFPFPTGRDGVPAVVGGGDAVVQLADGDDGSRTAAAELLRFLATPEAAAIWASQGGFLSPHVGLDLTVYPDDVTRSVARRLLEAGDDFHFDLSDLQPAAFGSTETGGLFAELRRFLVERDVTGTAGRLEAAARAAHGDAP